MDILESFSKLKKKFKHQGSKRKPERIGTDSGGENVDPADSLSRPVSHVEAGNGHDREDNGADADGWQIHLTDRPLQPDVPEPRPAGGSNDVREGVDGVEMSQRYSHLYSEPEVAVGSGPSQEGSDGERVMPVYPPLSTALIPRGRNPDST